jgi:enoyl-CoA hydratase/carnithine racemase
MSLTLSARQLQDITTSAHRAEQHSVVSGSNYLVADLRDTRQPLPAPVHWPACVVIGLGAAQPAVDVAVNDDQQLNTLAAAIDAQPVAAATLVQVLRHNEQTGISEGLLVESLAYSTLQQAAGFQQWLASADKPTQRQDEQPPLLLERRDSASGTELILTLNRPHAHNAYSTDLKDALCEALQLAEEDTVVTQVTLQGNGASFSAGGDLSEFGSVEDAGTAHLSRTTRSAAALLAALRCNTAARLHGACIGAGIELPAFTDHLSADAETFFQLPEVGMGLVPGAGGTVSVLKRIGRQRTAWMALTGARIDADTALKWGLIDTLEDKQR